MPIGIGTKTRNAITETENGPEDRIIHGLMYELWSDRVETFLGTFNYPRGEDYDAIEGSLKDCYGDSKTEGLLSRAGDLSFSKTYEGRPSIDYKFSLDESSGLYLGMWSGEDAFRGYSACKLDSHLTQPDADFIIEYFKSFDRIMPEERAHEIIGYMVGNGQLDVSRDERTGEPMFSLSGKGRELARGADKSMTPEERARLDRTVYEISEEGEDDIPF